MSAAIQDIPSPNGVDDALPARPRQWVDDNNPDYITVVDTLYGTIKLTDPVLLGLIRDASFQRLHGVRQHGITSLINVNKVSPAVTRLEHSLGAMLLVRHLAPHDLPQQCAALLHDISHTVLSHVTDYAFGYVIHEVEKEQYVETTRIPQILAKYGYDWKHITSEEPGVWTLLEQNTPLLCADRLDYGLRDIIAFDVLPVETVKAIVGQFTVWDGRIMCSDVRLAKELATGYMRCDILAWANPHHSGLYQFAGDAIRLALANGVIRKNELWEGTDAEFWEKILNCGVAEIDEKTRYVTEDTKFEIVSSPTDGKMVLKLQLKVRTIDPEIVIHHNEVVKVHRLSMLDADFAEERETYIKSKRQPVYVVVS